MRVNKYKIQIYMESVIQKNIEYKTKLDLHYERSENDSIKQLLS